MDGRMHRRTAGWACQHAKFELWQQYIDEVSIAGTYPDSYVFGESAPDKQVGIRTGVPLFRFPTTAVPRFRCIESMIQRIIYTRPIPR